MNRGTKSDVLKIMALRSLCHHSSVMSFGLWYDNFCVSFTELPTPGVWFGLSLHSCFGRRVVHHFCPVRAVKKKKSFVALNLKTVWVTEPLFCITWLSSAGYHSNSTSATCHFTSKWSCLMRLTVGRKDIQLVLWCFCGLFSAISLFLKGALECFITSFGFW